MGLLSRVANNGVPASARSYQAAQISRLNANWMAPISDANRELRPALRVLRARSRELERNNDYAKKYLQMVETNVIGPTGVGFASRVKDPVTGAPDKSANLQIQAAWQKWGEKGNCEVTRKLSWVDAQQMVIKTLARDGEVLIRKVRGFDNDFKFALQILEGDYLWEMYNTITPRIVMSVELDDWGTPAAYYVLKNHPGDLLNPSVVYDRYEAAEFIHLFIQERPGQVRGVPWMHSAMFRLNQVGDYEDAELVAARAGASKMGFYTKTDSTLANLGGDAKDEKGNLIHQFEPGTFEQLPPGFDFKPFLPEHPQGNYAPFMKSTLRGAASGLGVSYNGLASDLEGVNYSSLRDGKLDERDAWRKLQKWFVRQFCNEVFRPWLGMAFLTGQVKLPASKFEKFCAPKWKPRGWQWVDPSRDMEANVAAIGAGLNSPQRVLGELGEDLEEIYDELAEAQKLAKEKGITLVQFQPKTPGITAAAEEGAIPEGGKTK